MYLVCFHPDILNYQRYQVAEVDLEKVLNKTIEYLMTNYDIDQNEVLNPDKYKIWRDEIYPYGGPDNYIDFLLESKKLIK
jgi:hypothetical protein